MGLTTKDIDKKRIPSTYPKDHPLFSYYTEKYRFHKPKRNASGSDKTKAQRIAFAKTDTELDEIISENGIKTDKESISYQKKLNVFEILDNKPNYFLTLSMPIDFKWISYDRNYQTARLYKTAAVLVRKLMIRYDPSLEHKDYEQWPFFIGRMEHFDEEGNMVAPHQHILFRSKESLQVLLAAIKEIWGSVVTDAGASGIDLQIIPEDKLERKANYILKSAHQDNLPTLKNGVDPYKTARYAMWDQESIATDRWLLDRTTFRKALNKKLSVIARNSPLRGLPKSEKKQIQKLLSEIQNLSVRNKSITD